MESVDAIAHGIVWQGRTKEEPQVTTNIITADADRAKERERLIGRLTEAVETLDDVWDTSPDNRDSSLREVRAAFQSLAAFDAANGGKEG